MLRSSPRRADRTRRGVSKLQALLLLAALGAGGFWFGRDLFKPALDPILIESMANVDAEVARLVEQQVAAVREAPRDAAEHGKLGMVYEAANLWEEAQLSYGNAAELAPSDARWRYHRGICLFEVGRVDEAEVLITQAAKELTNEAAPQHRVGMNRLVAGDLDGAERAFQAARGLSSASPHPKVGLAEVAIERDDHAAAVELLETVVEAFPDYKMAHYLLGVAYRGLGRLDEAQRELALGTDAEPEYMPDSLSAQIDRYRVNHTVVVDRAVTMIERGRAAQAAPILEGVLARRPDDLYVLNMLAAAYVELNQFDKARPLLEKVIERDPEPFAALINLADCSLRENKIAQALQHAERAISIAPGVAAAHFARARAYIAMQAPEEAYTALKETIRVDSQYAQAHAALGEICCILNRTEEGIEHFKSSVRLNPNQLPANATLAGLLMTAQRFEEARPYVEQAEKLAPKEPRVQLLRERLEQRR